jgi:N-acyl amino acid synthase FeeM
MDSYCFGATGEYQVQVAADRAARERALALVYGVYLATGLTEPRESRMQVTIHDALPGTTSFLVERSADADSEPSAVASITLIPDGELGLPLDARARQALDALRSGGHRLIELAKLATVGATEKKGGNRRAPREEILLHLFKLAYLTALKAEGATDLIISVSKHQARFFRRVFFFETLNDPARDSDDDGLTVPLIMDLTTAEEKHLRRAEASHGEQHLYEFFVNDQEPEIMAWLARHRRPLSTDDARYLFARRSKLLHKVDEATRRLILKSYPGLEL